MATTPAPLEEKALTASAMAGDETALGRLLAIHQQAAYNVAYRLLGSEPDARDAVQDGFLLAVRAVRGDGSPPRDTDRFGAWLRRVVANAALGQLRRRPGFHPVSIDETDKPVAAPEHADPARAVERRETRGDVLRAILSLPDSQRAALTLREYEDLPYDDIAAHLGVSRGAVERLLFRARRGLRAAYEGLAATEQSVGCPEFGSLVSTAVDNELGTPAWQELKAHLDGCASCREELDGLRRSKRLYAAAPLLAIPAGWEPIQAAIAWAQPAGAVAASGGAAASSGASVASAGVGGGGLIGGLTTATAVKIAVVAAAAGIGAAAVAVPLVQNSAAPATATPMAITTPAASPATSQVGTTEAATTQTVTAQTATAQPSPAVPAKVPLAPPGGASPAPATTPLPAPTTGR